MLKTVGRLQYVIDGKDISIFVGERALSAINSHVAGNVHFIIDSSVLRHHEETLRLIIGRHHLHVLETSEKMKTMDTMESLARLLLKGEAHRNSTLVAIGGGVLGDICGFLASTYMRGIRLVHVPTTLLAMVDSAIGGKNGVNVGGKNMLGTIYQPSIVVADTLFLSTLPEREHRAGLAEVIKYGCIKDPSILDDLERSREIDDHILLKCMRSKMEVVVADPHETNLRAILNFGHTVGHALEAVTQYKRYVHGEAVAIGLAMEARLAHKMMILSEKSVQRICALITLCGLEATIPKDIPTDKLIIAMGKDKKSDGTGIPFVLPTRLGEMRSVKGKYVHMVSEHTVRSVLDGT